MAYGMAGIHSKVRGLQWDPGIEPAKLTNFESLARTLRYRQFAFACLEEDINALFLAHHSSDQVETTILRLMTMKSAALPGLRAMKPVNKIPCCEDIYGASAGVEASSLPDLLRIGPSFPSSTREYDQLHAFSAASGNSLTPFPGRMSVSHPGIKVFRPFLSFPKSRLIATCEANGVPFVTDPSNFDRTVTKRNAVRWLLSNNKMPVALRQESILRLRAASERADEARTKSLIKLMDDTVLVQFDLRSGRLVVLIPKNIVEVCTTSERDVAYYVGRLLDLVSPGRRAKQNKLSFAHLARGLFPELSTVAPTPSDKPPDSLSYTAQGVLMNRLPGFSGRLWELVRQPLKADEDQERAFTRAILHKHRAERDWSSWTLWDGRYWIRILINDGDDMTQYRIRGLRLSDMEELNARRRSSPRELEYMLGTLLPGAAPAKIRYTLPVLVKGDELQALPTLDVKIPSKHDIQGVERSPGVTDGLRWEIRYKDITDTLQYLSKPGRAGNDVQGLGG